MSFLGVCVLMFASFYAVPQPIACKGYGAFDPKGWTAAHRTLPCGTILFVSHEELTIPVVITDRGPYHRGKNRRYERSLDLSQGAWKALALPDKPSIVCTRRY